MKRTIIFFCLFIFSFATLHAAPAGGDLIGTWTATVETNRAFDTYKIVLQDNGRCTVKMTNDNAEQETTGNWSYDGTMFKLTALFRNAKIAYQNNIQWTSVLNFAADNNSFNILGKTATNGSQTRITFFRQDGSGIEYNEKAIPPIFAAFAKNIPPRSRLAVVATDSPNANEAAFYVNELTLQFVNTRNYTVVDRKDIDAVLTEQNFQSSGYVDDNAFVSIGKFLGATVMVTVSISGSASQKRMVIKAIDALTGEIISMASVSL